jgi:hypothetical protein
LTSLTELCPCSPSFVFVLHHKFIDGCLFIKPLSLRFHSYFYIRLLYLLLDILLFFLHVLHLFVIDFPHLCSHLHIQHPSSILSLAMPTNIEHIDGKLQHFLLVKCLITLYNKLNQLISQLFCLPVVLLEVIVTDDKFLTSFLLSYQQNFTQQFVVQLFDYV